MKRLYVIALCFFVFFPMYAISNITLYMWENKNEIFTKIENDYLYGYDSKLESFNEKPDAKIENSKLYELPDNSEAGIISEENGEITISYEWEDGKLVFSFDSKTGYCTKILNIDEESEYIRLFSSETGFPEREIQYENGIILYETYFDNTTHREIKCNYYDEFGNLDEIEEYDFSIPNVCTTKVFDEKNELIEIETEEYNDDKYPLKKTTRNVKGIITEISLYNGKSYSPYDQTLYYEDGKIKKELKGDFESGDYTFLNIYSEAGIKTEYKFIKFDEESNYKVDSNFTINTSITAHYYMNDYAKKSESDYVDWNEHYYALVSKYDFNVRDSEFRYLRYLKDQKYLIQSSSVIIYNPNNSYLFCFSVTDFEIEFDSCYKIELIRKPSF